MATYDGSGKHSRENNQRIVKLTLVEILERMMKLFEDLASKNSLALTNVNVDCFNRLRTR